MIRLAPCLALIAVTACTAPQGDEAYGRRACGALACITSPYLKAKLSPAVIGQPVSAALARAGAPSNSYRAADGTEHLAWRREQRYGDGMLACEERIVVGGGRIADYRFDGHC